MNEANMSPPDSNIVGEHDDIIYPSALPSGTFELHRGGLVGCHLAGYRNLRGPSLGQP
jgi:hypothetical protein